MFDTVENIVSFLDSVCIFIHIHHAYILEIYRDILMSFFLFVLF